MKIVLPGRLVTNSLVAAGFCAPCEAEAQQAVSKAETKRQMISVRFASDVLPVTEAAVPPPAVPNQGEIAWSGILAQEGVLTGDGRFIQSNAITWDTLPVPLRWCPIDNGSHDGAIVVGKIENITRDEAGNIMGEGTIDTAIPEGAALVAGMRTGLYGGVSVDLDDMEVQVRVPAAIAEQQPPGAADADGMVTVYEGNVAQEQLLITSCRMRAATMVPVPAFAEAHLSLAASGNIALWTSVVSDAISNLTAAARERVGSAVPASTGTSATTCNCPPSTAQTATSQSPRAADSATLSAATRARVNATLASTTSVPANGAQPTPNSLLASGQPAAPAQPNAHPSSAGTNASATSGRSSDCLTCGGSRSQSSSNDRATSASSALSASGTSSDAALQGTRTSTTATALVSSGAGSVARAIEDSARSATTQSSSELQPTTSTRGAGESSLSGLLSLVASALPIPVNPPEGWFGDPGLKELTPLTFTDDGRVFGHIAGWGSCHQGFAGQCVTPPKSQSNYAWFNTGALKTAEGTEVHVGRITMDTGHAGPRLTAAQTVSHYDNTGAAVADVHAGQDKHGIYVAGALRPGITPERLRALRSAPMSGDWRSQRGGNLELVGILAVNLPGFPVPRAPQALVASGAVTSLQLPIDQLGAIGQHPVAGTPKVGLSLAIQAKLLERDMKAV